MRSKAEILARRRELDRECWDVQNKAIQDAENAGRHHRAGKQGAERLGLIRDCLAAGGHVYEDIRAARSGNTCMFCDHERETESATVNASGTAPVTYGWQGD